MTEPDVARIGTELGVAVPPDYRALMLAFPQDLRDAPYNSPVGGRASDSLLFDDPQRVIRYNRRWRDPNELPVNGESEPWPDEFLIIGEDGGGNCWCVKLDGSDRSVWFFEHADGVFVPSAASCEEHVDHLRQLIADVRRG